MFNQIYGNQNDVIILSLHNCEAFDEVKKLTNESNHNPNSFGNTTTPKSMQFKKRLGIGVPYNSGFPELLNVQYDFQTNKTNASGFCIDVFKAAIEILPYELHYDFFAFFNSSDLYDYNNLVYQVYLQKYDAVVGDVTIMANRSLYVDFTLPFTEPGIGMVGLKQNEKSKWIFLKPLTRGLWLASAGFLLFTGFVVWIIERPRNDEFQGPASQQTGTALWFSFSTLVFAHREKLMSNLSRFVVIVWVFVVLVLTSSYTATLTSMLTLQQINLKSNNIYIGYLPGSFTRIIIDNNNIESTGLPSYNYKNIESTWLPSYNSSEAYSAALSKGSKNGGVSAIMDEMPYIKLFLAKYGHRCSMIRPVIPTTNGFGFGFPKGSQMARDMSRAIATLREEGRLLKMENAMLNTQRDETFEDFMDNNAVPLTVERFQGLFLISGLSSVLALTIFSVFVLRSKWYVVVKLYDRLLGQTFKFLKRCISENMITRITGETNVVHPA